MGKYIVLNVKFNCIDAETNSLEEARTAVKKLFDNPDNYHPRAIYRLVETYEVKIVPEIKITPAEEEVKDTPKTLLEVVQMTAPTIDCYGDGCPYEAKFKYAFESKGYKRPEYKDCSDESCEDCWNREAEKVTD